MRCFVTAVIVLTVIWKGIEATNYDPRCHEELPDNCEEEKDLLGFAIIDGQCALKRKVGSVTLEDPNWPFYFEFLKCAKAAGIDANQLPYLHAGLQLIVEKSTLQKPCSTREKAQAILDRQEKRKKSKESKESKDRKPVEQKVVEEQKTQKSEHVISVGKDGSKVQDKNSTKPSVPDMVIENTQESDETCRSRSAKPKTGKDKKKDITKKAKQPQPLSERTARDSDVPPSVKALNAQKKKANKPTPKKNSGAIPSEKTAVDSETDRRKDNRKSAHVVKAKDAPKKAKGENLSEKTAVDSEADRKASRSKDVNNRMTVPEPTKNKSKKGKLVPAEKTSAKPEVARAKPKAKDNKEKKSGTKGKDTPRKKKDSNEVVLSERTALGSEVETMTTEGSKPLTGTGAKPKTGAAGEKKAVAKEQQVSAPASKKKEKVAVVPKHEVKGTKREDGVGKAEGNSKFVAEQDKKADPMKAKKGEMPKKK